MTVFSDIEEKYTKWFSKNMKHLFEIEHGHSIYVDISVFEEDNVEKVEESLTQIFVEKHSPFKVVGSNENIVAIFRMDEFKDEFGKELTVEQLFELKKRAEKNRKFSEEELSKIDHYSEQIEKALKKKREEGEIKCKDEGAKAWTCPKCGREAYCPSAMSRIDYRYICSICIINEIIDDTKKDLNE